MLTRKLLILAGAVAVVGANSLALSPIAPAIAASFPDVAAPDVMIAAGVYGLATAISALTLAPTVDRIGQQAALLRALIALIAAFALSAVAPNLWVLCTAQALAGLAAGCALPAIYALSAVVAEKGHESQTLGIVLTGWTVSLVAGVSLAAVVADVAHWRVVFVALAAGAAALARAVRRGAAWVSDRPVDTPSSPLTALRVPRIIPALLTVAAYMTAFYGLYSYLGAHLVERLHLSTAAAGLAPLAYGLGFGVAVFADRLLDRHGAANCSPFAFLGLGLVYLALSAASAQVAVLIGLCLAWGVANHIGLNLIVGRLAALDPTQRGATMGLYSAVTYLAVSAGALVYRPLYEQFGFAGCATVSAAFIAPVLALSLVESRQAVLLFNRKKRGIP
jgi:predicted MFS family arabinose efflux permease